MVKILLLHKAGGVVGLTAGDKQRGNGPVSPGLLWSGFIAFSLGNTSETHFNTNTVERIEHLAFRSPPGNVADTNVQPLCLVIA